MVDPNVDGMVDFDVSSRLEVPRLEIIDADTQDRFVYLFKNSSNGNIKRLFALYLDHIVLNH